MTQERDDDRLKEGFAKLRDADQRRAPPFERLVRARARTRVRWGVLAPVGAMAAMAAAMLLWCRASDRLTSRESAVAAAPQATMAPPPAALASAAAPAEPAPADQGTIPGRQAADGKETAALTVKLEPAPLDFLLDLPTSAALAGGPRFDALEGSP